LHGTNNHDYSYSYDHNLQLVHIFVDHNTDHNQFLIDFDHTDQHEYEQFYHHSDFYIDHNRDGHEHVHSILHQLINLDHNRFQLVHTNDNVVLRLDFAQLISHLYYVYINEQQNHNTN